jgi:hypothetical protein
MTVLDGTPDYRLTRDALSPTRLTARRFHAVGRRRGGNPARFAAGEVSAIPSTTFNERLPPVRHRFLSRARSRAAAGLRGCWTIAPVSAVSISNRASRMAGINVKFRTASCACLFESDCGRKLLSKNYKSIEKQVKDAFKPKKK